MDITISNAQLVTVPIMDARLASLEAKLDVRFAAFEARMDARFSSVDARLSSVDASFVTLESRMEARTESLRADVVRWVLLAMLGNVALSSSAAAILNFLQR